MKNLKQLLRRTVSVILILAAYCTTMQAQNGIKVTGTVTDGAADPLIGASVIVKGNSSLGTVTDFDGNFQLTVPSESTTLVISYVGMSSKEIKVGKQRNFKVTLQDDTQLQEVVVVGFGQQKKASVVGAITQTTGEVLERAAGIGSVGAALTGNLPGVATIASTGQPGEEDPVIYIRGAAAWNVDAQPLILVDGVEREIKSVDITSVATVSVLKDASATAVYGVKGANGVILITTKRGQEGKARIDVGFNATLKAVSKLPRKYDSYDGYMYRNQAIEHELALSSGAASWEYYRPQTFINNFRNQDHTVKPNFAADGSYLGDYSQAERYANVDWQDEMFRKTAMSYNTNINFSGGTKAVKYFVAFDYQNEGDMTRMWDNHQGYEGGYAYNRLNVRSNLDFQITKTTLFKVNLAGSNAQKKAPRYYYGNDGVFFQSQKWAGAYGMAPNLFPVKFSDGTWGYYPLTSNIENSPQSVSTCGYELTTTTRIFTDFVLEQNLDFITKGLVARGTISWDNQFNETGRGIADQHQVKQGYILPEDGKMIWNSKCVTDSKTGFDFYEDRSWTTNPGSVSYTSRATEMSLQLFWSRQFGDHNVSLMGNWKRRINAGNADLENRREDWVFRTTYDYKSKYFAEFNGAYNGSQKFSPDLRFAFFCSGALGWMISEEPFMKKLKEKRIIDMFKIRGSIGEIGDDNAGSRWAYLTTWGVVGPFRVALNNSNSPFTGYKEESVAAPDVKWATVLKKNIGFDYAILGGMFAGSFDYFRDDRKDIFISGGDRTVPSYFGAAKTPDVNQGKIKNHGFEFEVRFNKVLKNGMRFWANANYTYAHNEIILKDDPKLIPSYRKAEGYSQGQIWSFIDNGFIGTYDELYSTPAREKDDDQVLIGDHYIVDFNGDGVVDETNDQAPYGYTMNPEHTYNATIGWEWKGWSCFAQFYGVTGVTRDVGLSSFNNKLLTVYDNGTWWNPADGTGDVVVPRFASQVSYNNGTQYLYDGSYFRLKNVEIAYTWTKGWIKKLGFSSFKIYLNGNNLFLITKMPDDREGNLGGFGGGSGAYPTVRRYNLGFKLYI